jgi:adenylate kinase
MFIVFVGPPGVGKGTQCRLLAKELGLLHLSTGEVLRKAIQDRTDLGSKAAAYIDLGQLVPDDVMIDLIDDRVTSSDNELTGCLLDGFPRTLVQAEALDLLLQKRGDRLAVAIELMADRDVILKRLSARAKVEGRSDDDPETISRRLKVFDKQTAPIVGFYQEQGKLRRIDGNGSPESVHARVLDCVRELTDG